MSNTDRPDSGDRLFLFVTANDTERDALLNSGFFDYVPNQQSDIEHDVNFYNIGRFGCYDVIHLDLVDQASVKSNASAYAIPKAIDAFHPDAVIAVGVAFGIEDGTGKKQTIGDVLVSRTVTDYESGKIHDGEMIHDLSGYEAGECLKAVVHNYQAGWKYPLQYAERNAYCIMGDILSGDKFVDDIHFKTTLVKQYPWAAGGEMEGRGIHGACRSRNLNEWIIVKGICDWADGNAANNDMKKENQQLAAGAAVSLLAYVFADPKAFDKLPRNKKRAAGDVGRRRSGAESRITDPGLRRPYRELRAASHKQVVGPGARTIDNLDVFNSNEVLKLCAPYIKKRAIEVVTGEDIIRYKQFLPALRKFITAKENAERWAALNELTKMITTIKKPSVQSGQSVSSEGNLGSFAQLHDLITRSDKFTPYLIKGQMKLGKSSIMSLFFFYALYQFHTGRTDHICFYINIDETVRLPGGDGSSDAGMEKTLGNYIARAKQICRDIDKTAVFLVDGLSDSNLFGDPIEAKVRRLFNRFKASWRDDGSKMCKTIYIIDESPLGNTEKNHYFSNESVDYLVYFNKVDAKNVLKELTRGEDLLRNYAVMMGFDEKQLQRAKDRLEKYRLPQIDFNFISTFQDQLFGVGRKVAINHLYEELFQSIPDRDGEQAIKNAHRIINDQHVEYKTYSGILDVETFSLITSQYNLLMYCAAKNYVGALKEFSPGDDTACFDLPFDKIMAEFALGEIEDQNLAGLFVDKIIEAFDYVSDKGKSTMAFLTGKIADIASAKTIDLAAKKKAADFIDKQIRLTREKIGAMTAADTRFDRIAVLRSLYISRIIVNEGDDKCVWDYIRLMFADDDLSMINRTFNRFYYGDIRMKDFIRYDTPGKGFDFYCTFHWLSNRLQSYCDTKRRYPLLEVDLFLICNLFQVRTENVYIDDHREVISFLYNLRHIKGVKYYLGTVIGWIDIYLNVEAENQNGIDKEAFCRYLKLIKDLFTRFIGHIEDASRSIKRDNIPIPGFSYINEMVSESLGIFDVNKRGWLLRQSRGSITDDDIITCDRYESLESAGEHIYATYLLGLVFLPDKLRQEEKDWESYDKQKVLNTILIHDIGEARGGDYPSHYVNKNEKMEIEDAFNTSFFLLGTFSGADSLYDYYRLWKNWYDGDNADINAKIAKDLNKIQMLYKLGRLLCEGRLRDMDPERIADLKRETEHVYTPVGKSVLRRAVLENPAFSALF